MYVYIYTKGLWWIECSKSEVLFSSQCLPLIVNWDGDLWSESTIQSSWCSGLNDVLKRKQWLASLAGNDCYCNFDYWCCHRYCFHHYYRTIDTILTIISSITNTTTITSSTILTIVTIIAMTNIISVTIIIGDGITIGRTPIVGIIIISCQDERAKQPDSHLEVS